MKPALRVLVPDPLLFAALAVAAERARSSACADPPRVRLHREPTDIVAIEFGSREAHLTLGLLSDEIQYDVQHDRVTLRSRGGSTVMVFTLDEPGKSNGRGGRQVAKGIHEE